MRNRPYRGSVSLSSSERVWDVYQGSNGVWYLNQRGRMRPPYEYSSRQEAEARREELSSQR
jgi:hypothetical protein